MATSAISSHGTLLKIGDGGGGGEVFTTIAEVLDITGTSLAVATEDVTNHDSSAWREFIATIKEGGEVTFELNYYSAATQDTFRTDMLARTKRNFKIVYPLPSAGTETHSFAAYITGMEYNAPVEGVLRASCSLQITGAVTVA